MHVYILYHNILLVIKKLTYFILPTYQSQAENLLNIYNHGFTSLCKQFFLIMCCIVTVAFQYISKEAYHVSITQAFIRMVYIHGILQISFYNPRFKSMMYIKFKTKHILNLFFNNLNHFVSNQYINQNTKLYEI